MFCLLVPSSLIFCLKTTEASLALRDPHGFLWEEERNLLLLDFVPVSFFILCGPVQCLFCLHSLFLSKRYPHIYFLFIHPGTNIACAFLPDSTSMQQIMIVPYTPRLDLNREREQVGTNKHSWYIFRPPSKQDLKRSGDSAWGSLSAGLNSSLLGHKAGWQCHALLSFAFNVIFSPSFEWSSKEFGHEPVSMSPVSFIVPHIEVLLNYALKMFHF